MPDGIPRRLSIVTLGAHDVAALRAFYERLGWESSTPPGDFAAFPLGGAVFTLYEMDKLAEEAGAQPPPPGGFRGVSLAVNVDAIEDVDAVVDAAVAAGATRLADPVTRDWGGRSGYFADPEGNAWEVAWLPDSTFDERGALVWPY
ncbi:MAG TPA: VOC family protein [Solirubrobacteraceae bacterium]|nr:VOC family protein [Solirubrobacteraceae bacterium]